MGLWGATDKTDLGVGRQEGMGKGDNRMSPLFDYRCTECSTLFIDRQAHQMEGFFCPRCGGNEFEKLPSAPSIRFNGSGFYENDYKNKKEDGND